MKPLLETNRLKLCNLSLDDVDFISLAIFGDPEVMKYVSGGKIRSRDECREWVEKFIGHHERHGFSFLKVILKSSGEPVGICGLIMVEGTGPEIEIAYHFSKSAWGNGYATEASREVLRYGFDELKLESIIAMAEAENRASIRVMEKIGMSYRGRQEYYGRALTVYASVRESHEK